MDTHASPPSLEELYDGYAPACLRRARLLLGSSQDAWDVVHQVFCKLAERELHQQLRARPMTYLYRAITNACLNELAAGRRRARLGEAEPDHVPAATGRAHALDLLEKLDCKLDETDRRILVLAYLDGLPQEEIAEVLGVWTRTVGRRLRRLRGWIEELEGAPLLPLRSSP